MNHGLQIELSCIDDYGNPMKRLADVYLDREPINGLHVAMMVPHGHAKLLRQPQGPALQQPSTQVPESSSALSSSLASASPPQTAQAPLPAPPRKLELADYLAIEEFYLSLFSDRSNVGFGVNYIDHNITKRPCVYCNDFLCQFTGIDLRNQYTEAMDTATLARVAKTVVESPLDVRMPAVEKVCALKRTLKPSDFVCCWLC
jgi:hypothetical protein